MFAVACLAGSLLATAQEQPPAERQQPMPGGPQRMAGQGPGMQGPGPGMMQGPGPGMMRGMRQARMGMMARRGMMRQAPGMARMGMGPGPGGRPGMGGPGMGRNDAIARLLRRPEVQKELGITPEQRQKFEDLGFESSKTAIQERANLEVRHLELGRMMRADTPDRGAIEKKIQEISQAQGALMRAEVLGRLDARNILTKEQRARLPQLLQRQIEQRMQRPAAGAAGPARPRQGQAEPRQPAKPKPTSPPQ